LAVGAVSVDTIVVIVVIALIAVYVTFQNRTQAPSSERVYRAERIVLTQQCGATAFATFDRLVPVADGRSAHDSHGAAVVAASSVGCKLAAPTTSAVK
jgi:hypothetical protein